MRSIRWYTTVFWLGLIFVFSPGKLFTQEVEITNVTVLENNHVQINWEFHDISQIRRLGLYRDTWNENLGVYTFTNSPIYEIPDTSHTSFIDSTVELNRVRTYQIAQLDEYDHIKSNKFNTIDASVSLDSCQKSIQLEWTRHFPKQTNGTLIIIFNDTINIGRYNIWRSSNNGGSYKKIGSIYAENDTSRIDTSYTDPNIDYDHIYRYFIEGVLQSDTSIKSRSNRISINPDMPDDPQYIHLDSLSTWNGNIHLSFSIDEDSELHRYVLLRSQGVRKGTYDTIKSYDQPGSTIRYIDESVDATRNRYYYHLAAVNQCGALTTRSDTLNNLVLTVTQQNLTHQLDWNEIRYLPGVVYQVYRKGGDTDSYQIHLSTGRQAYLDTDIQHFKYDMVSKKSEFCYYVRAKINHTTDRQSVITSNKRCVYAEPQIFLPNAFIPNARMQENRGFKPEFSFVPQHYLLIIYDRMGRKVFQSADPEDKWEGKIQGGQKAPAGTYTYYLEVKNPGAPLIRKRGEITLIYR